MNIRLSHTEISSYVGDVFPLRVLSDADISDKKIGWSVDGDAAQIRCFENDPELPFTDAVLVSLKKAGHATVRAALGDTCLSADISVRERLSHPSDHKFEYYRGDMHTHTTRLHDHEEFINRKDGFQDEMVGFIKDENLLDFGVMSDHSSVMGYGYEFMRAFLTEEAMRPMGPILFPGSESEVEIIEKNKFGLDSRYGGELVVINADNHTYTFGWDGFIDALKTSVAPVVVFAHPQADSFKYGNWNFRFEEIYKIPEIVKMAKCMEMGSGIAIKANLLHEYAFSRALDRGFRITTTCGSDGHGIRGYKICPGKTILMAAEKSREAFLDALLSLRAYACESANVKLRYSVNGFVAPADLPLTDKYSFRVELDYFDDDPDSRIVKCQVVSDRGEWIREIEVTGNEIEFEIESSSARYFYLRLQDSLGRRTWSPPVWCSRPFDEYIAPNVEPIDNSGFTAYDTAGKCECNGVLSGDITSYYESPVKNASIVIDMKEEKEISALGYITPRMPRTAPSAHGECVVNHARYPRRIRISTSIDGENYEVVYNGGIRIYAGEEIFEFASSTARFVKLDIVTTIGDEYGRAEHKIPHSLIGLIELYKAKN